MAKIDFEAKTDRELLVLVAQASNGAEEHLKKLNGTIQRHETRLVKLESRTPSLSQRLLSNNLVACGAFGSLFAGVLFAFGQAIGWW